MAHQSAQDKAVLYGLSRLRAGLQFAIAWFQGLTALGSRGQIKNVVLGTNLTGTVGPDDTLTIDATGGGGGGGVGSISCTFVRPFGYIQPGDYATLDSAPGKTITAWRIASKDVCSISVDVRVSAWPTRPTAGDSIIGNTAYEIKLTTADHNDGVTSSWSSAALTAGQRVEFYVKSATGARDVTIQLEVV